MTSWRCCLRQVYVSLANLGKPKKQDGFWGVWLMLKRWISSSKKVFRGWIFAGTSWTFMFWFANWNFNPFVILIIRETFSFHSVNSIKIENFYLNKKAKNFSKSIQIHRRLKCSIIFMSYKIKPKPRSSSSPPCPLTTSSRLSLVFRTSIHNDITITFSEKSQELKFTFFCIFFSLSGLILNFWFGSSSLTTLSSILENCLDNIFGLVAWGKKGEGNWGWQVGENVTRQMGMTKNWLDSIDINYKEREWRETSERRLCTIIYQSFAWYLCFKRVFFFLFLKNVFLLNSSSILFWVFQSARRQLMAETCRKSAKSFSDLPKLFIVFWDVHMNTFWCTGKLFITTRWSIGKRWSRNKSLFITLWNFKNLYKMMH